jgi:CRISPR-associated endonuclease/helicase Cas3
MKETEYKTYFRYWGKAEKDGSGYHLLPYHCLDVAAVGKVLLEKNPLLLKRLSELSGIEEIALKQTLLFSLSIHDLGKYSETFQFVMPALLNKLQGKVKSQKQPYSRRNFCHGSIGFLLWKESAFTQFIEKMAKDRLTNSEDDWWWDIFKWFLETSNGHHGLPVKQGNKVSDDYFAESDKQAVFQFVDDIKDLFPLEQFFSTDLEENYDRLYAQLAESSWVLAGLNVLCDWIGSDEIFKYHPERQTLHHYWHNIALKTAEVAVKDAGILPCKSNCELDPLTELLDLPQNTRLTPLQDLIHTITLLDKPQLFIIEDETGAGKTEACLILLNRLMAKGLANGFYLGLPTMATADGIYPRVQKAYNNFYLADQKPSLVLAHSSAKLSDKFTNTIIYKDSEHAISEQPYGDNAQSACQDWLADNRKKALLAHIGVGTIDQAFLAVLKTKYQSLRLIGLVGKVLVIDEAHAYDAYMGKELEVLLHIHASLGGSAIIMSATLPFSIRQKLSNAFLSGLNAVSLELEKKDAYPLLTHIGDGYKKELTFIRKPGKRKKAVRINFVHSENDIYEIIRQNIKKGHCVCWIRNSVRDARQTFQLLKDEGMQIELFHARFTVIDRLRIQHRVISAFDKNSGYEQRKGKVVIATQVVEQSLDLDFDVMITDLAPIDLMLQRAGRMHRHIRDKAGNPKIGGDDERCLANLYIFTPEYTDNPQSDWFSAFFPNAKKVYENHARLWLSLEHLRQLPGHRLPKNIRNVVENVYGKDAKIPQRLSKSDTRAAGNESSQRTMGSFNTINFEAGYTMDGQVWEDDLKMPTRLGEETVIITLGKWEDERLTPFTPVEKQTWQKNEIRVLKKNIAEIHLSNEQQVAVDMIKQLMPGKSKWINVLPMVWDAEKALWAADVNGLVSKVYYSSVQGLLYGYELEAVRNDDQLEKDELI